MKTTLVLGYLLGLTLVMSAASAAARSDQPTISPIAGAAGSAPFATTLRTVGAMESTATRSRGSVNPLSNLIFELLQPGGNDGDNHDGNRYDDHDRDHQHDYDHNHDHDHDHDHDKAPIPSPEPVTALLFGAAMLVGGGILRRRRRAGQN
jgi:hypothetical protein